MQRYLFCLYIKWRCKSSIFRLQSLDGRSLDGGPTGGLPGGISGASHWPIRSLSAATPGNNYYHAWGQCVCTKTSKLAKTNNGHFTIRFWPPNQIFLTFFHQSFRYRFSVSVNMNWQTNKSRKKYYFINKFVFFK